MCLTCESASSDSFYQSRERVSGVKRKGGEGQGQDERVREGERERETRSQMKKKDKMSNRTFFSFPLERGRNNC